MSLAGRFGFRVQNEDQQVVQSAQVVEVPAMGGEQVRRYWDRIGLQQATRVDEQWQSVT